jgi:hypothetical protein
MMRLVLAVTAVLTLGLGLASPSVQAKDCTPTCYKHPITGQLICTPPCP